MNRGTICAEERTFRLLPFRGNNCGLIPYVNGSGSITSVVGERANLSAVVYL